MQPALPNQSSEFGGGGKDLHKLHKRGRWYILQGPPIYAEDPIMYHQCKKATTEEPEPSLFPVAFTNQINIGGDDTEPSRWACWVKAKPRWRCQNCRKTPPDSIITVFTLLTYDETTKEVAKVTQDWYNCSDKQWWGEVL